MEPRLFGVSAKFGPTFLAIIPVSRPDRTWLSQVHKFEASPSIIRFRAPAARPSRYQNSFSLSQQARSLHASRQLSQEISGQASSSKSAESDPYTSPKNEAPAVSSEASQPDQPTKSWGPSKPSQSRTKPPFKPRSYKQSSETRTSNIVKREASSSTDSRAFKGVFDERPKGPIPGEPQSKVALWKAQKAANKEKYPDGWRPRKRLSPDALAGIRALNAQFPEVYTTAALAQKFEVSPEVIRRILRSKWQPTGEEEEDRQERWFRRGKTVWEHKAALGIKPPQKWRREGVARDPSYHAWRKDAIQHNRDTEEREDQNIRRSYGGRSGKGAVQHKGDTEEREDQKVRRSYGGRSGKGAVQHKGNTEEREDGKVRRSYGGRSGKGQS
ncbi:hypothetical protein FZEAL_4386 [Fusarium zealandicum]|uniref:Required for respiratory growth protein 9, mitochondrial n=1 Tax=Fusarium zealandicum TaxID=1053134 RepID=A0A8H4XLM3_9HYPO|nr:hypothetical protein FZEAL_4386 [Fusarium zealandicum]